MSEFCCWLFHSHNFIMYRNAWERGKKGKTVGSVPVTCVRFTARVWPVPSAGRLQGLFGPRVSFYWGVLRSSVLAWRIPGTGEPGGPPSMGSHRVRHDWSNLAVLQETWVRSLGHEDLWERRNCQSTPIFLPGKFHGQRSLPGYSP